MGFSDLGCYGGEIANAEPRRAGRRRACGSRSSTTPPAAARPAPSLLTGPLPAPGRRRPHDGRHGASAGLSRRPVERTRRHDRRGAQARRLRDLHGRQVARHDQRSAGRPQEQLAAQPRVRPLLRHDQRGRQLLRPAHARPRQTHHLPARTRSTSPRAIYYTDAIGDQASRFISEHAEQQTDKPFFLYVAFTAPTGRCTRAGGRSPSTRASTTPGTSRSAPPASSSMKQIGLIDPTVGAERTHPTATGTMSRTRSGKRRAWRCTRRMVDRMDQGIGKSSTR